MTCSTKARSVADTAGQGNRPVMPCPTKAGVLGMLRTTRSEPNQRRMLSVRMPAATDRCRAWRVWGLTGAAASAKTWGLTAQTTRSAWAKARLAAFRALMPKSAFSLAAASAKGSTTVNWSAVMPWRIRPPMMALAMLPPPMNAMWGCAVLMV
jgi:hypothetical protein